MIPLNWSPVFERFWSTFTCCNSHRYCMLLIQHSSLAVYSTAIWKNLLCYSGISFSQTECTAHDLQFQAAHWASSGNHIKISFKIAFSWTLLFNSPSPLIYDHLNYSCLQIVYLLSYLKSHSIFLCFQNLTYDVRKTHSFSLLVGSGIWKQ